MYRLTVLYAAFAGVLAVTRGEYAFAKVERYQLDVQDHLNAVRILLQGVCLEQNNCSSSAHSQLFFTLLRALEGNFTEPSAHGRLFLKVILQGVPVFNSAENRLFQRTENDQFRMDCVFLQNDEVIPGGDVESQLNERLLDINKDLELLLNQTAEHIRVISVRKLQFPETLTWVEYVGATLLAIAVLVVALTAGSGAVVGFLTFVKQMIKKSEVVWETVELQAVRPRSSSQEQEQGDVTETAEPPPTTTTTTTATTTTTTTTITANEPVPNPVVLEVQTEDAIAPSQPSVRLSTFKPIE